MNALPLPLPLLQLLETDMVTADADRAGGAAGADTARMRPAGMGTEPGFGAGAAAVVAVADRALLLPLAASIMNGTGSNWWLRARPGVGAPMVRREVGVGAPVGRDTGVVGMRAPGVRPGDFGGYLEAGQSSSLSSARVDKNGGINMRG